MSIERLLAALDGAAAPLDDDPEGQLARARSGVAVAWLEEEAFLRIGGSERASFLHRLLTADLVSLAPGQGRRTLLLDNRGRVLADLDLWGGAESWLAGMDRQVREETAATLRRFVLRSDVVIEPCERTALALAGPGAPELLSRAGLKAPGETYESQQGTLGGARVRVARSARSPWGLELIVDGPAGSVVMALQEADSGLGALGPAAREALRIGAGVPRAGRELTGAEFPQEAGLETAVSFDKGCYLGQETVARIHYRGHVNRLLCGLALDGPADVPASLLADGREAGVITSVTGVDGHRALGYVRTEHAEPGRQLEVDARPGASATVREVHAGSRPAT